MRLHLLEVDSFKIQIPPVYIFNCTYFYSESEYVDLKLISNFTI